MSVKVDLFSDEEKAVFLARLQKTLPNNWVVQFSKKHVNRVYFFNKSDGTRTWKNPGEKSSHRICYNLKRKSDCERSSSIQPKTNSISHKKKIKHYQNNKAELQKATVKPEDSVNGPESSSASRSRKEKRKKKRKPSDKELPTPIFDLSRTDSVVTNAPQEKVPSIEQPQSSHTSTTTFQCRKTDTEDVASRSSPVDIEMMEVSNIQVSLHHDNHTPKVVVAETVKQLDTTVNAFMVIVDTNVLLCKTSLDSIRKILDGKNDNTFKQNITFIIPWVVLQELDHLKKSKHGARSAISFLNMQFQANHSRIRGQSIFEAAAEIDGFIIENNDDRILQCCFFMQNLSKDSISLLLTRDKNLMNKALANNIKCFEEVFNIKSVVGNLITDSPNRTPPALLGASKSHALDSIFTVSPRKIQGVHEQSRVLILSSLSHILEKEMKTAFGDLWHDIVLRKPPWDIEDVVTCIRKHWVAVFKQIGLDHTIHSFVNKLVDLCNFENPENFEFVKSWLSLSISLISGINKKGNYGKLVTRNLDKLKKLQCSLKTPISVQDQATISCSNENQSVEMAIATAEFNGFWSALDKIWTSIISHCGMIFQSLNFTPSKIAIAPEVCEAISAKFDTIPSQLVATHALPFVTDLIQSLENSLKRILEIESEDTESVFVDLIHTLWTTIQAFHIDCDIKVLIHSHSEICAGILSSDEMTGRLRMGLRQLEVVRSFLEQCLTTTLENFENS